MKRTHFDSLFRETATQIRSVVTPSRVTTETCSRAAMQLSKQGLQFYLVCFSEETDLDDSVEDREIRN